MFQSSRFIFEAVHCKVYLDLTCIESPLQSQPLPRNSCQMLQSSSILTLNVEPTHVTPCLKALQGSIGLRKDRRRWNFRSHWLQSMTRTHTATHWSHTYYIILSFTAGSQSVQAFRKVFLQVRKQLEVPQRCRSLAENRRTQVTANKQRNTHCI